MAALAPAAVIAALVAKAISAYQLNQSTSSRSRYRQAVSDAWNTRKPPQIERPRFRDPNSVPTIGPSPVKILERMTNGGSTSRIRRTRPVPFSSAHRTIRESMAAGAITRNFPSRSLSSSEGLILSHCEPLLAPGLNAAGALAYSTNAIIPPIFPYLIGIAQNFSKYRWLKLHFYYVPACPTSTLGEIAMSNFYDWQDASAATFIQTAQMKNGVSFPPWGGGEEYGANAVTIDVDCKDFDKARYLYIQVAAFNALSTSDRNNYAPVNLAFATQGSTAAVSLAGRIWCSYTIQMLDPIPTGLNA